MLTKLAHPILYLEVFLNLYFIHIIAKIEIASLDCIS